MVGVVIFFTEDFRQILLIVPKSTTSDDINVYLKSSFLWPFVRTLKLTINMHIYLDGDINAVQFARTILNIGNRNISDNENKIY